MREILFRGKTEKFGNWIEGSLIVGRDLESGRLEYLIAPLSAYYTEVKKVVPETVGQYTGLTDKNGTKVFEGDILHFKAYQGGGFACSIGTDIYYRVLFGHCNPDMNTLTEYVGFWALGKHYDEDDLYEYGNSISYLVNSHGACVIGNIHDNPELLERSNNND